MSKIIVTIAIHSNSRGYNNPPNQQVNINLIVQPIIHTYNFKSFMFIINQIYYKIIL